MRNQINTVWRVKAQSVTFAFKCRQTFTETFAPLYYRPQVSEEEVPIVQPAHAEGSSLRGISRGGLAYDTVVSIVRAKARESTNSAECPSASC
jgi:hypothetical protein